VRVLPRRRAGPHRPHRGARELRGAAGAPQPDGLLSEDLDPKNGRLWGNFLQTYSTVGIINGAMLLSKPRSLAV
jgi:hypothetical protein